MIFPSTYHQGSVQHKKGFAPGEARTLNLRISLPLVSGEGTVYKYGALTDCATGAPVNQKSLNCIVILQLLQRMIFIKTTVFKLCLAVRWPSG